MKNTLQTLQSEVRYVTDEQGNQIFVQIPFAQWQMICLQLTKEETQVEETTESPELVDKQGVLVVKTRPLCDLTAITRHERNGRIAELRRRTGV